MLDLFSDDTLRDPYPLYAALRAAQPVLFHEPLGLWALFEHAAVKRALTDHEAFGSAAAGGVPGRWLIFQDPPRHTVLRALVSRAFTPRAVQALAPRIAAIAEGLVARALPRGEIELVQDFALPLPLLVIAEMLGAPASDLPRLRRWGDAMLGLSATLAGGEVAARAVALFRAANAEMEPYVEALVEARRREPTGDLLSALVSAEVAGERLGDEELLAFFQLLLFAGHETTTNLLGCAVLTLLEHPEEAARVARDPAQIPAAIEELLRYRSPVQVAFRVTRREVEIDGHTIPAGKTVLAVLGSANRDPKQFVDPDRFDPARDASAHVAFGHGAHFCLGAALARLEARVALGVLLTRLPRLERASEERWEPRPSFQVHGPARLPLRFARAT